MFGSINTERKSHLLPADFYVNRCVYMSVDKPMNTLRALSCLPPGHLLSKSSPTYHASITVLAGLHAEASPSAGLSVSVSGFVSLFVCLLTHIQTNKHTHALSLTKRQHWSCCCIASAGTRQYPLSQPGGRRYLFVTPHLVPDRTQDALHTELFHFLMVALVERNLLDDYAERIWAICPQVWDCGR
jgi:hypothetical protein